MSPKLLDRPAFARETFARSGGRCVACGEPAADPHHILERRLFREPAEFGGYFLDNGAALCPDHHMDAETTRLSVEDIRAMAGIASPVVPARLDPALPHDKWGNPILPDGSRLRGPLFREEPVQKVLAPVLALFRTGAAAPRTRTAASGVPGPGPGRISLAFPAGRSVAVDAAGPEPRGVDPAIHALRAALPTDWRVLGVAMDGGGFVATEIWDGSDTALGWADTLEWSDLLGVRPAVPHGADPIGYPVAGRLDRPAGTIPFRTRWDDVSFAPLP
jgi:hypothetical protein